MTAILNAIRKHLGGVIFSLILSLAALRGIQVMSAQPQPPKVASPYLSYGRFYLERSIPAAKPSYYSESEWQKESDDDRKTYWRCDYPVFSGGKAAAVINRTLRENMLALSTGKEPPLKEQISAESAAEDLIASYLEELRESGSQSPFHVSVTGSVLLNKPGLLTVRMDAHLDCGGAHGLDPIRVFVFNSNTGSRLKLADIFVPRSDGRLSTLIERAFRRKHKLSDRDPLDKPKGDFPGLTEKRLSSTENFALGDKGIIFVYHEYEIACYAFGSSEILVPWGELQPILKEDFKAQLAAAFAPQKKVQ